MPTLSYEVDIKAPISVVYNYCTDPDNIKETWAPDIVKDSTVISGTKGEKGSMFKVKGSYNGKDEEMRLMVIERWPNAKYTTKQTEGPFKKWESVQEFEDRSGSTHLRHTINYELPRTGRILKMVRHDDAHHKLQEGMEGYIRTLKFKMEAHA